jgi:hypothetical protein
VRPFPENDSAVILINRSVCIAGKRAPTGDRRHTDLARIPNHRRHAGSGANPNLSASHWGWRERKTVGAGLLANALVQAHRRRLIDPVRQQPGSYRSMSSAHSKLKYLLVISAFLNSLFKNISASLRLRSRHKQRPPTLRAHLSRSTSMSASLRSIDGQDEASILREIQSALRDLRFGAVEITVHNAQVVQIERKEKFRLQNPGNKQS